MVTADIDLDRPVWGADAIAGVLGLASPDGTVSRKARRKVYHLVEQRRIDVTKLGPRELTSTPRRLLRTFIGGAA
jgi:hypothetical protein